MMLTWYSHVRCRYDVSASSACSSLAERWSQCNEDTEFTVDEFEALSSTQGQEFLNQLLNKVMIIIVIGCVMFYFLLV